MNHRELLEHDEIYIWFLTFLLARDAPCFLNIIMLLDNFSFISFHLSSTSINTGSKNFQKNPCAEKSQKCVAHSF